MDFLDRLACYLHKVTAKKLMKWMIMMRFVKDYCLTFTYIEIYFKRLGRRLPGWDKSAHDNDYTNRFLASSLKYRIGSFLTFRVANYNHQSNTV